MRDVSIFDILGPIMIGPSSSHTAGAVRLGNMAAGIFHRPIRRADFYLHGSFAKTYRGHGTDLALVAGIMGLLPDDERIRQAYALAEAQGIEVAFHTTDLGYVHPNTVAIELTGVEDRFRIIGSSLGGGAIEISRINETDVLIHGEHPTLILSYQDKPGVISQITSRIAQAGVNIAAMKVSRQDKLATTVLELDGPIDQSVYETFEQDPQYHYIAEIGVIKHECI